MNLVLSLFKSFLLVVIAITLFVMPSPNSNFKSGSTFLLSLLYWISKQPEIWSRLFCLMVELNHKNGYLISICMY